MPLEVPKAAVVGDDLEPVANRLPAAPRAVAAVAPLAGQLGDQLRALQRVQGLDPSLDLRLADRGGLEERRGQQVVLAPVDVDQLDRRRVAGARAIEPEPGRRPLAATRAVAQVGDPFPAAVRALHPGDEARDHLARAPRGSCRRIRGPPGAGTPSAAAAAARRPARRRTCPRGSGSRRAAAPRNRSRALARIDRFQAASGSSPRGQRSAAHDWSPSQGRGSRSRTARPSPPGTARRAARPSSSGSRRRPASAGRRGCIGWTAPDRRRGARAEGPW